MNFFRLKSLIIKKNSSNSHVIFEDTKPSPSLFRPPKRAFTDIWTQVKPEEHGERLPRGRPNTSTLATTHVEQLHWPFCGGPNMGECKLAEQRENNTYLINNFFVLKEKNLKIKVILGQVLTKRYHLFILLYNQWLIFKWIKTGSERNLKVPINGLRATLSSVCWCS